MEKEEKYLPIGTVVMLKGGSKRVMISGFGAIGDTTGDKIWDYSGCMYPEGFMSSDEICLFDHAQIDKIYYLGLIDEEEEEFHEKLNEVMNLLRNGKLE